MSEYGFQRRTVVKLSDIPVHVRQAFLATEDKRFYSHHGIDFIRLPGAMLNGFRGFSTITQQLARNVFSDKISRERSPSRKLREARVALELERNFPKDTILELYLNQIDLGPNVAGVESAAQVFFGKSVRDLNVAEAATLAAQPKAPGTYNPRTHPDNAVRRRNVVLNLMRDQGFLTPEDAEFWKAYPLVLTTRRTSYGDVAPYFVEWLRTSFLEPRFGRDLYEKGLRIYTTLDLDMEVAAEQALQSQLDEIESGVYSNGKFEGTSYRQYIEQGRTTPDDQGPFAQYLQGSLLALDAKTGNILAMVGGRDFSDSKWNRVTQSRRPPGSTFKPFVYSAAIRAGHPVTEMLDDSPLPPVIQLDSSLWQPKDYDDTTLGLVPMRQSLYLSRNLSTIKLGMSLGEQTVIGEARRYGITTPLPPYPSIHIGARETIPMELIAAYTSFANNGTRVEPIGIQRIEDRQGNILAPAWTKFMRDVYQRRPSPGDWARPDDLVTREVDWSNGFLATPFCPLEVRRWEWFYPGTEPSQVCQVHSPFGVGVTP